MVKIQMASIRFWMSGKIQSDVGDYYREASNIIEAVLNQYVEGENYGEGLKEWGFIAIILKSGFDEYYPEIKRYRKKKREVEFRLKINYKKFLKGNAETHLKLMAESVLRSFDLMREMNIKDFDLERLTSDVTQCLSKYLK
ncbi:MAG: Imm44 family immunity protein [Pseudomonadota bacterium]